ncbi:MAG: 2,3-bisphosphoglycerate-independent phosphoglycerate mutase [Candidatus Methanofastidiosia archaeon]
MILIISDGIGDVPVPELYNKTPLEYGDYPSLDRLSREGINGIMDPLKPGFPAGSDTAHIALLGEDPRKVYRGRGYLEALGTGLEPGKKDIAFRVNFATVDRGIVTDRRAKRATFGIKELVEQINENINIGIPFILKEATGTRAALILKGNDMSSEVSDGDPHVDGKSPLKFRPLSIGMHQQKTAKILNDFVAKTHEFLKDNPINKERAKKGLLPANYLLIRGAGTRPDVQTFQSRYGVKPACIAATALIRGVAKCFGFDLLPVKGMTGEYNTDEVAKADTTLKALKNYDFIFTHFKPTDTASHDGNPAKKIEMISKLDNLVSIILECVKPEETVIALTGDHSTPCCVKDHTGEPVPLVIWGGRVRTDDVSHFDERSCSKGGIGRIEARHLVNILMNQASKLKKYGA